MATRTKVVVDNTADKPTEQLTAAARAEHVITDPRGRRITLRKPQVLAQFNIVKALGAETASNSAYMNMVLPLLFVTRIDDEPVFAPASQRELDALINRLDDDGVAAVLEGVLAHFAAAQSEAEVKAEVRK